MLRLNEINIKPIHYLIIYISLIFFYALIYFFLGLEFKQPIESFVQSLYFSTVTITTLGYGEIHPVSASSMIIAASQAFMGIVAFGFFLNSVGVAISEAIRSEQEKNFSESLRKKNFNKLKINYELISSTLSDFEHSLIELTTPIAKNRSGAQMNPNFKFPEMIDIFKPSMRLKNGFHKNVIDHYFSYQIQLIDELISLLNNVDMTDFSNLNKIIVDFIKTSKRVCSTYEAVKAISNNGEMIKIVEGIIEKSEDYPEIKINKMPNLVDPFIAISVAARHQMHLIKSIKTNFDSVIE